MMDEEVGLALDEPAPAPSPDEEVGLTLEDGTKPKEAHQPDEIPDKYTLEGEDEGYTEEVGGVARELGIGQEKLQRLATAFDNAEAREVYENAKKWVEDVRKDPDIGGANFDTSIQTARSVFDKYSVGDELRQILATSGITNHPDFIRMFVRIGQDLGVRPGASRRFKNSHMED